MSCCQDSPYSQDRKSITSIDSANVLLLYIYYLASSFTVHCALLLYALMTDMHRIKSFHFEMFFGQPLQWLITYRVSEKNGHKIEEEMTEKIKPKVISSSIF